MTEVLFQTSSPAIIPDDYGLIAIRATLDGYPKVAGERICRDHYADSFSILLKLKPNSESLLTSQSFRVTLLNITLDGTVEFALAIEYAGSRSRFIVMFGNCEISEVHLPFDPINLNLNEWHQFALAVTPGHIDLYQDCRRQFSIPFDGGIDCRVVCDERVEIGVLEDSLTSGTVSMVLVAVCNGCDTMCTVHFITGGDCTICVYT